MAEQMDALEARGGMPGWGLEKDKKKDILVSGRTDKQ